MFRIKTGLVLSPLSPDLKDFCASLLVDLGCDPMNCTYSPLHLNFPAEEIRMQRQ